ncbi:hypothetical protein AQJ91_47335 [Streptomyces dysideae]|uniref:Uncharacterized protein n=1 Tax=Streptomyces dysideae TaxID=909626 RepID=A0A117RX74_9ACTN|nr:hypothetical protein AQJ91_47335 [Streptomyces dysideae]
MEVPHLPALAHQAALHLAAILLRACTGPGSAAELITASPSETPRRCEDQPMDGLVQFLRDRTLRVRTPTIPSWCWPVAWCRSAG